MYTDPSAILPDSPDSAIMLRFPTVHSRCASAPCPPTFSIDLPSLAPLTLVFRDTFSCPTLSITLPLFALDLLSPMSSRYSQDSIIHHLGLSPLFIHPQPSHDFHAQSLLCPLVDCHLLTPHGSPCMPLQLHTNWISGFLFIPTSVLSSFHRFPPSSSSSQLSSSQIPGEIPGNKARKIRVIWKVNRNREGRE